MINICVFKFTRVSEGIFFILFFGPYQTLEKRSNDETKDPKESKKTKEKEGDDEPELKKRKLGRKQNTK